MAEDNNKPVSKQDAPAPRNRGNGISEITEKLKSGSVEVDSVQLNSSLITIAKNIHVFGKEANAKIDVLATSMGGNKLKELETNKENIARTDETNELLSKILKKELVIPDAPTGWWGRIFAIVGGLSGIVAGLVAGFVLGIGDSIITATTLMTKGFNRIIKFAKSIGKFGKLVGGLFSGNIKVFRGANGAFKALPLWAKAIQKLGSIFNKAGKSFSGFTKIGTQFGRAIKSIKDGFLTLKLNAQMLFFGLGMLVDDAKALVTTYKNSAKGIVTKMRNGLAKLFKPFDFIIDAFRQAFKPIAAVITTLTTSTKAVGSFGLAAKAFFRPLGTFFKFAFEVFKPIGRLLGKLFFPLTIIMGIFDGVRGAIDGVANNKEGSNFVAGMFGALKGILIGVVGLPLDMLKDAVAWLFAKMGMTNIADIIKDFSFSDLVGDVVDAFKSFTMGIVDFFVNGFKALDFLSFGGLGKIISGMGDLLRKLVAPILIGMLPADGDNAFKAGAKMLAAGAANKLGMYDWAGVDYETGDMKKIFPDMKVVGSGNNGEEMMELSTDNANNKKSGSTKNEIITDASSTNTQVDNSSTTYTPTPGNRFDSRRKGLYG